MALTIKDPDITLDGDNVSEFIKSVTVNSEFADNDVTTFASGGAVERIAGLEDGSLDLEFVSSFDAGESDALLWAIRGQVVPFTVRMKEAAVSTANPIFSGKVLINAHSVGGSVGDAAASSVSFPFSGPLSRATA